MSCHDPHEDLRVAHGAKNQVCVSCHQDYMGPWIYDPPPVTEDCGTCHNPHGAVTQNLLGTMQPVICLSCHTLNDTFHHDMMSTGIPGNTTITQNFPTAPGETIKPNDIHSHKPLIRSAGALGFALVFALVMTEL